MLIQVTELSQAGDARRKVTAFAEKLQIEDVRRGDVALVTTELATNLVKHAKKGQILAQAMGPGDVAGLRVMGIDKGPGITDITRALTDGHSTVGSMGIGLGAVRRMSDRFEIYSGPGLGTVVVAEFWQSKAPRALHNPPLEIAVVSEPISGEQVCGDGWSLRTTVDTALLMVVDGLGHGILAAEAAREAEKIFAEAAEMSPTAILNDTHAALRKTRGAAEAVVRIELERKRLSFAGVGNISASIVSPTSSRSMASHNGTLGMSIERVQEFTSPWNHDSVLVMHTDGLASRWDFERYPGLWTKAPSLIAAVLHRDFCRQRDDVTVLVARTVRT